MSELENDVKKAGDISFKVIILCTLLIIVAFFRLGGACIEQMQMVKDSPCYKAQENNCFDKCIVWDGNCEKIEKSYSIDPADHQEVNKSCRMVCDSNV